MCTPFTVGHTCLQPKYSREREYLRSEAEHMREIYVTVLRSERPVR
jgi:hypothetical protein